MCIKDNLVLEALQLFCSSVPHESEADFEGRRVVLIIDDDREEEGGDEVGHGDNN